MGTGYANATFGAYFGMHLQAWLLDGLTQQSSPKTYWPLKMVGRAVFSVSLSIPFYALTLIRPSPDDPVLNFILWMVPLLGSFFVLFSICDFICLKV